MARAATQTKQIKIPQDIEYRVIGNAFGLLIASGGLLAGAMVCERSLEYWRDDIVPLGLVVVMGVLLLRSLVATMNAYQEEPLQPVRKTPKPRENVKQDHAFIAQIPETTSDYTTEQVLEAVARRIEEQKAEHAKKQNIE